MLSKAQPKSQLPKSKIYTPNTNFLITAVIPHKDTPETLSTVVEILNLQTEQPYILIIDTGSNEPNISIIESLRSDNVEIHYIKAHYWRHTSEPVAVAQDLALSLCKTKFMFCTHADCFLQSQTLLSDWLDLMSKYSVVGYQISPRPYKGWQKEFGHTALMFNVLDIKSNHINWDMEAYCLSKNKPLKILGPNDPDTESNFNRTLQLSNLKTLMLGGEENFVRNVNEHFDHPRSYASSKFLNLQHFKKICPDMQLALQDAQKRISSWKAQTNE